MADWTSGRYAVFVVIMQGIATSQGWLPKFPAKPKPAPSTTVNPSIQKGKYPDWNFTDGLGGWQNKESLRWSVVKSLTRDVGILTGQQGTGDGFAIIKPKKYVFRKKAKLYSNFITGPVCMRFYFYLHGKKTGQIKILTKRKNSKSEITMFKQYGNHGHHWNFAQVFLDFSPSDIFQVTFTIFLL